MSDILPLPLLDTALRAAALALLVLLGLAALRGPVRRPLGRVTAALAGGLALQLLGTAPAFAARAPVAVEVALAAVSMANAVVLWLFARAWVDARFALRRTDGAAWALVAGASLLHCALALRGGSGPAAVASVALGLLPLAFGGLALRALLARRAAPDDAVRGLGALIVGGGFAYALGQQLLRLDARGGRLDGPQAAADAAALLALLALVAWRTLRLDTHGPWTSSPGPAIGIAVAPSPVPRPPRAAPARDHADDRLLAALDQLMSTQRAYRDEGLGIAALAARLDVPEYRLRRAINQRLGHRNFTAYLNGLRLAEARAALADPAQRQLPVLTIALSAGFQSIGPFNRAFKAETGLTPTEFRCQKLADS